MDVPLPIFLMIFFDDFTAVKTLTFYDIWRKDDWILSSDKVPNGVLFKKIPYFAAEEQFFKNQPNLSDFFFHFRIRK